MSKKQGVEENILNKLIKQCQAWKAEILRVDVVNGTGIVELDNGTPSSVYYDTSEGEWM